MKLVVTKYLVVKVYQTYIIRRCSNLRHQQKNYFDFDWNSSQLRAHALHFVSKTIIFLPYFVQVHGKCPY